MLVNKPHTVSKLLTNLSTFKGYSEEFSNWLDPDMSIKYEKVKTAISPLSMHTLYSRSKIGHKFGNHQFMIYFQLGTSFYLDKPFFIT